METEGAGEARLEVALAQVLLEILTGRKSDRPLHSYTSLRYLYRLLSTKSNMAQKLVSWRKSACWQLSKTDWLARGLSMLCSC